MGDRYISPATVTGIRRAMEKLNMTLEGAMEYMDIPPAEQPEYVLLLQEGANAGERYNGNQ